MIKAVFFDLGDTLWHFPAMPSADAVRVETVSRLNALLQSWSIELTPERAMLGRWIKLAIEDATEKAFHGDCIDPNYPEICRRVAAQYGMELTLQRAEQVWDTWNLGGAFLGRVLFPDALDTLRWLKSRGYRLGAITNRGWAGPRFDDEMRELGLTDLFEAVTVSCLVGYMKPHPRIYELALKEMGARADQAVMVGDSLRGDIEGAKRVGMIAVWRRPPVGEPVEETTEAPELEGPVPPDFSIDNIGDLKDLPIFREGLITK